MKISISRTGGFGGIRVKKEIDTSTLSEQDSQKIESLVMGVFPFSSLDISGGGNVPDGFRYHIRVETELNTESTEFAQGGNEQLFSIAEELINFETLKPEVVDTKLSKEPNQVEAQELPTKPKKRSKDK